MDTSDPSAPKIVHAFLPRDTPGYRIVETWDTLVMEREAGQEIVREGSIGDELYVLRRIDFDRLLARMDPGVLAQMEATAQTRLADTSARLAALTTAC